MYFPPDVYKDNAKLAPGIERARTKARSALADRYVRWRRAYWYFHNKHDETMWDSPVVYEPGQKYPWRSAIFRPLVLQQLLSAIPRLDDALAGGDFAVLPYPDDKDNPADSDVVWEEAKRIEHLLKCQFKIDLGWDELRPMVIQEAKLYGTCVVRLEWYRRAGPAWGMLPVEAQGAQPPSWEFGPVGFEMPPGAEGGESTMTQKMETKEDRLKASIVPLGNWWADPRGRSLRGKHDSQPCRYAGEDWTIPTEDFISWVLATKDEPWECPKEEGALRAWLKQYEGTITAEDDWQRTLQSDVGNYTGTADAQDDEDKQLLRILSFWEGGSDPWHVLTIGGAGAPTVLKKARGREHPALLAGIPYVLFKPVPKANELYGYGLVEMIEQIQHELNSWTNLRLTSFRKSIHGITLVNKSLGVDPRALTSRSDGVLLVGGHGPLREHVDYIERKDPGASAYRETDELKNEGNLTGGATEPLQGMGWQQAGGTVRGYALTLEQGGKRWGLEAVRLGLNQGELAELALCFDRQYVTRARWVEITNKTGPESLVAIGPELIGRKWRLYFTTAPVIVNEGLQLQNHTNFVTTHSMLPGFNAARAIVDGAKLNHKERPEEYSIGQTSDAQLENLEFTERGYFAHPAQMADNDEYHIKTHLQMVAAAQQMGETATISLQQHIQSHQMKMGAMAQPPGPPGPPGVPGEEEMEGGEFPRDLTPMAEEEIPLG